MSLLITSSKQPRVGGTVDIGIEKPFNYINNFQNPLKVPANSEIAVESVKINRQPRIQAKDKLMLGWFGKRFHQTSGSSVSETSEYIIPNVLPLPKDSSSPIEFADQLKEIFNDMYTYHPDFNVNKTEVNVSYTTTGAFAGYEVSMETCSQLAANRIPDSVMVIDAHGYDENASGIPKFTTSNPILFGAGGSNSSNTKIEYDDSSGSITAKTDDTMAVIAPEGMWEKGVQSGGGPLSLLNGSCQFVVDGKNSRWWVGLARSHSNHYAKEQSSGIYPDDSSTSKYSLIFEDEAFSRQNDLPDFSEGGGVIEDTFGETERYPEESFDPQYWDYVVHQDGAHVRIFHSVYRETGEGPKLCHEEIKYYEAANGSNSSFATGTPIVVGAAPSTITFQASNDGMFIYDQNGSLITGPINVTTATEECVPKPIDQGCLRMYPKVCFENASGKTIQIKQWTPRTATTSPKIWGDDWYGRCSRGGLFGQRDNLLGLITGGTTPQKVFSPITKWTGGAQKWPMDLAKRPYLRPDDRMGDYEYRGISGSGLLGKEIINIVGSDSPYTESPFGNDGKLEWQANIGPQVGSKLSSIWPEMVAFGDGTVHGSFTASFVTAGVPVTTADRAAYIRVPTLTHQSFNGATGNQSKILFQVPKFDNAGNDSGALQFQAQDRLYLDLNNAADLNITDINVQFVSSDERFSDDLTGQASVLFHIRPKM
tara:strand:+ start:818 stop:2941 length:2124 start_codon:yes stop_codon:yes gene_type:complete